MWVCPFCNQKFVNTNQHHSCRDKTLSHFLNGKSEHTISLFWLFVQTYLEIGPVTVHPTKSMIGFAARTRFAYITRLGKNFVDVTFPFNQPYSDNLCFQKIAKVPGTSQFNHHLRMMNPEDLNKEVLKYMKMAYKEGS